MQITIDEVMNKVKAFRGEIEQVVQVDEKHYNDEGELLINGIVARVMKFSDNEQCYYQEAFKYNATSGELVVSDNKEIDLNYWGFIRDNADFRVCDDEDDYLNANRPERFGFPDEFCRIDYSAVAPEIVKKGEDGKTIAERLEEIVDGYDYDEKGKKNTPEFFLTAWREQAVEITYPLGKDSFDATEGWKFIDGSYAQVDNPRQVCYCLNVRAVRG